MPVAVHIVAHQVEPAAGGDGARRVLARQQPARERIVDGDGDAEFFRHRHEFLVQAARDQVVHLLGKPVPGSRASRRASASGTPARRNSSRCRCNGPCRPGSGSAWPPWSCRRSLRSRAGAGSRCRDDRFRARRRQASTAFMIAGLDRPTSSGPSPIFMPTLLASTSLVAPAAQQRPQEAFGAAGLIGVGGVDEVDPCIEAQIEHAAGVGRVHLLAERHGAEAKPGQAKIGAGGVTIIDDMRLLVGGLLALEGGASQATGGGVGLRA